MKAREVIDFMNAWAPLELAEDWDNVGFQIGSQDREISKIILALDLDHRVLERAKKEGAEMIISHHPFIFSGLKSVNDGSYDGRLIINMIKSDIISYNAHTNLDQTRDGVNEELGRILKLKDSEHIEESSEFEDYGYGRIGDIEETSLLDYIQVLKASLELENLIVYGDLDKTIKRVAVMGGSGSGFISQAYKKGADLYITGDIKYHDAQVAEKLGMTLIDAGHYHTEKPILNVIKRKLEDEFKGLEIIIHNQASPPFKIY